ncbi:MAG: HlyD family efflux transporter periplasmic adaptor subunit [Devosia sp.]
MLKVLRVLVQGILPAVVLFGAYYATQELIKDDGSSLTGTKDRPEVEFAIMAHDVTVEDNRAVLRAFGEVVAADSADLRVASPGEVIDIHPDLVVGKIVEEGAPLVTIDPFAYDGALREARAKLAETRARRAEVAARIMMEQTAIERAAEQLTLAERDLERAKTLLDRGALPAKAVDDRSMQVSQRRLTAEQRQHTLEAERARLLQMDAAVQQLEWQVERAGRALEETVLYAPFKAIVRAETAAKGRLLAANDVAVSLIRADALDARFILSDQRFGKLVANDSLIGTPVTVTWRIGDVPLTFDATIRRVAADISSDKGGVDVYARIDLPADGAPLRPGAFVEVAVPGRLHTQSVRLPATALYRDHVFVVGDDNRLERRAVTVLARDGQDVIVSGDLALADPVMTTRLAEAGEGIKVRRAGVPNAPGIADADAAAEPAVTPVIVPATDSPAETPTRERS